MVLAAGLGTRLRPLTDDRPKALVTVGGHTLLEIVLRRLRAFGVSEVIVNAHHHAEMIVEFLAANDNLGMRIEVSREEELLDTGGGLKRAAHFFLDSSGGAEEPFLVHNVDVISGVDLARMVELQTEREALATLAVQERVTSRSLLFDEHGQLCGRRAGQSGNSEMVCAAQHAKALAFSGIHVVSPKIFAKMDEQGAFSIIDAYLRLAAAGEKIVAYRADESYWRDLGRAESLAQAERDLAEGKFSIA
jgi:NDP-sugar pyrophosphorylase family protein